MTYEQNNKGQARELQVSRQIWLAFFVLTEPVDPDSFLAQLKNNGLIIERGQVYHTLTLLTDYGFADRSRNEDTEMTFYRCR